MAGDATVVLALIAPGTGSRGARWGRRNLLLLWLGLRAAARLLTRPADLRRLRYVARFRLSPLFRVVIVLGFGGRALVLARLGVHAVTLLDQGIVSRIDSYFVQTGLRGVLLFAMAPLVLGYLSLLPTKLLVFTDHLRVKYLAYRSRVILPNDVEEIRSCRFAAVWLSRQILHTVPLTLGLVSPGILLRTRRGPSYFFAARDPVELVEVLDEWRRGNDSALS